MSKKFNSLQGQLLLDGGKLRGSFFHRTVVLICQHDAEGAFGLVINRASGNKIGDVMVANLPDPLKELPLYVGGPVQPGALSFLYTGGFSTETPVLPNLHLSHSLDELAEISDTMGEARIVRVFAGYAGWSPGQLDDEMQRNSWLTHPASLELIFQPDPSQLWKTILSQKGWQYRLLASSPDDLAWN
jgi:putative transcriptional regulator